MNQDPVIVQGQIVTGIACDHLCECDLCLEAALFVSDPSAGTVESLPGGVVVDLPSAL